MTTDYKALCAELVAAWKKGDDIVGAMNRARAALAVDAVGPDTDDVLRLAAIIRDVDVNHDIVAAALAEAIVCHPNYGSAPRPIPVAEGDGVGVTDEDAIARMVYERALWASAFEEVQRFWPSWEDLPDSQARDCAFNTARAILARLDATHPRPIPVAERPWEREGFCDARGLCWWTAGTGEVWTLCRPSARATYGWMLPAAAIPLPEVEL